MSFRDRIKELRRVKASELIQHPKNWRIHPPSQTAALKAVLAEVGWVDAVLARETKEGLELIDGHLRADIDPDADVPVLVVDVDEQEAEKVLITHDSLTGMAEPDPTRLNELLVSFETDHAALNLMVDDLQQIAFEMPEEEIGGTAPTLGAIREDEMELRPEEHYDYLVVCAENVNDWNRLCRLLGLEEVRSSRTHRRIGLGRAVNARKLLDLIE